MTHGDRGGGYGRILRSSAITGGSTIVTMLIGLVAVKAAALIIGPDGVGELRLYQSAIGVIAAAAGMGLVTSGTRTIAQFEATGNREGSRRVASAMRRVAIATGLLGWIAVALLCAPLSSWVFGDSDHAFPFAVLGATVLMETMRGSRMAAIWGLGLIGRIAQINVVSAIAGAGASIAVYAWLGAGGIVVALMATAALNLAAAHAFARDARVDRLPALTWSEAAAQARGLVRIGMATMVAGLMTALVATVVGAMIVHMCGLRANGMYAAAWGLSGLFANFVLNAMAADFFPRLSAAHADSSELRRLVGEQTEVGVLLATPGLVATICFAPWIIEACYSAEFVEAAPLLVWLVLGVFGRVTSWPLAYVLIARGEARVFILTEVLSALLNVGLVFAGMRMFGLAGVGIGFFASYVLYNVAMSWLLASRSDIRWTSGAIRVIAAGAVVSLAAVATATWLDGLRAAATGVLLLAMASIWSARGLARRLGHGHRIVRTVRSVPGFSLILGPTDDAATVADAVSEAAETQDSRIRESMPSVPQARCDEP